MRGKPRDIDIVKVIIVVANLRCSHNVVNINRQLGQAERGGVSSMLHSAAKLVICLLAKRLLWLSVYELRTALDW